MEAVTDCNRGPGLYHRAVRRDVLGRCDPRRYERLCRGIDPFVPLWVPDMTLCSPGVTEFYAVGDRWVLLLECGALVACYPGRLLIEWCADA